MELSVDPHERQDEIDIHKHWVDLIMRQHVVFRSGDKKIKTPDYEYQLVLTRFGSAGVEAKYLVTIDKDKKSFPLIIEPRGDVKEWISGKKRPVFDIIFPEALCDRFDIQIEYQKARAKKNLLGLHFMKFGPKRKSSLDELIKLMGGSEEGGKFILKLPEKNFFSDVLCLNVIPPEVPGGSSPGTPERYVEKDVNTIKTIWSHIPEDKKDLGLFKIEEGSRFVIVGYSEDSADERVLCYPQVIFNEKVIPAD